MKKIDLKRLVNVKFLWGSLIVLLLALSIIFYVFKEEEKTLRINTQQQLAETVMEKKTVENELIITLRAKEILQEEVATEKQRSLLLGEQLREKERKIKLTLDQLEEEVIARRVAETQLIAAMKEKSALLTKLKEIDKSSRTVALERIVVKAAPKLAGRVLMANKQHAFIVVDLGREDNLQIGEILSVYRNGKFIGRVQVEKVEEGVSAAAILPEWQNANFKENDEVREI